MTATERLALNLRVVRSNIVSLQRKAREILVTRNPEQLRDWYKSFEEVYNNPDIPEIWKTPLEQLEKQLAPLLAESVFRK